MEKPDREFQLQIEKYIQEKNAVVTDGWIISIENGYGRPPACKPMIFFCVLGPYGTGETRVDGNGLKDLLPVSVYNKYIKTTNKEG